MSSFPSEITSLHINCGGDEVNINNTNVYEGDIDKRGASTYYSAENWAFSSTGTFLDNSYPSDVYILSNMSSLQNISISDTELYTKARTAAISLTYYGLCLRNGNYNVRLHFAEIIFTQDNSFNSLGKRVFDIYVQVIQLLNCIIAKNERKKGQHDQKVMATVAF
ncbi:hypothetical protein E3N88_04039 [Mikania micrantha]|uniref:Malectin domain-containing protein n=1 Tax=Mikania micrantha TaxID=192012 RepID=A0A5N6PVF5_9ASTR|nr:hypothetical protein E3N88_04039 [Mikania micrantha]